LSNVSGHELSEARTDPTGAGWFDTSGAENGDKCAWTFNVPLVTLGSGSNSTKWKIQGEWSNAAYNAGTGYANSSGQKGCLDGR
jgi:hypothetical protein